MEHEMVRRTEEELDQRRERAYSLYLQMRPWIRRERKLKALIKKAVETQYLANQRIDKANAKIIEALGIPRDLDRTNDPGMYYADEVAHLYQTIEDMAEDMAKGEFELDSRAVECVRNIGRYKP